MKNLLNKEPWNTIYLCLLALSILISWVSTMMLFKITSISYPVLGTFIFFIGLISILTNLHVIMTNIINKRETKNEKKLKKIKIKKAAKSMWVGPIETTPIFDLNISEDTLDYISNDFDGEVPLDESKKYTKKISANFLNTRLD
jgi:predicted membrane protein